MKKLNVLYFLFRVSEKFPFISLAVVVFFFGLFNFLCGDFVVSRSDTRSVSERVLWEMTIGNIWPTLYLNASCNARAWVIMIIVKTNSKSTRPRV